MGKQIKYVGLFKQEPVLDINKRWTFDFYKKIIDKNL